MSQRPAWQAVREQGAKVFVAGSRENFDAMGDLLDVLVWSGVPDKVQAAKWHDVGQRIFDYANPQVGVESPEINRRNFGFTLWKANYDGAMTWEYQSSASQGLWHDFNCDRRTVAFALPTADGLIDTIGWEGYREGIDDIRYGSTLLLAIEHARQRDHAPMSRTADQARRFLEELDQYDQLDVVRAKIIQYILALQAQAQDGSK